MAEQISFKARVCNAAIQYSQIYFKQYVSCDYLVLSDAFHRQPYYIISAEKSNYLHLVGVSTSLSPLTFFEKCYNGTLSEDDFEISTHGHDAKASKGSVRRKINALPFINGLIDGSNLIEEGFQKNVISCTIASSDGACTLGFIAVPKARPKTLLIGNELDQSKAAPMKTILSKERSAELFDKIHAGSIEDIVPRYEEIKHLLCSELRSRVEALIQRPDDDTDGENIVSEQQTATHPSQPSKV